MSERSTVAYSHATVRGEVTETPTCWYCQVETDRSKLQKVSPTRYRCTDLVKCKFTESRRFLRVNHDNPRLIRGYDRMADAQRRFFGERLGMR